MSDIVLVFVLGLHLACVHVAAAGPMVSGYLVCRQTRHSIYRQASSWLVWLSLAGLILGAILGVLVGWIQYRWFGRDYHLALSQLGERIIWGSLEIATYVACVVAFFLMDRLTRQSVWTRAAQVVLLLIAGTNLLYHFPPLFAVLADVAATKEQSGVLTSTQFRNLIFQGEILSSMIHFWGAAFVVTGVTLMHFGRSMAPSTTDEPRLLILRLGARIALVSSLCQFPIGVWLLVQLPSAHQAVVLGDDPVGTLLLFSSLVFAVGLMHHLAAVSFGSAVRRKTLIRTALLALAVVLLMSATGHRIEQLW